MRARWYFLCSLLVGAALRGVEREGTFEAQFPCSTATTAFGMKSSVPLAGPVEFAYTNALQNDHHDGVNLIDGIVFSGANREPAFFARKVPDTAEMRSGAVIILA